MAITISGQNNNDKILASDGVLDQISGFNVVGVMTATTFDVTTKHTANHIDVGSSIQLGNAGIITATTLIGNVTGNVNSTSHLLLQISGSEKFRVGNGGQLGIGGANYGSSGQVLTSGGSGSAPTWSTIASDKITEGNTEAEVVDTGSDGHFKVTTEGTERLRVNSSGLVSIPGDIDVDGHTNLDNVSIAGVTTVTNNYFDFKPTGGGNAHFRMLSTGTGDAGIFFDAANGDISGSDYCFIGQKNNLDFVIDANANAGNIDFQRAGTTQVRIDSSGRLVLGTTSAFNNFGFTTSAAIQAVGAYNVGSIASVNNEANGNTCAYTSAKIRGTNAVNNGDVVGSHAFDGYDGGTFRTIARIDGVVSSSVSSNSISGDLAFRTRTGSTQSEVLRITGDGKLTMSSGTVELQSHMVRVGNRTTSQINAGVSTATGSMTFDTTTNQLKVYTSGASAEWKRLKYDFYDGQTAANAARSAKELLDNGITNDGVYYLNMHGAYTQANSKLHYCLMDTSYDGGGWTLLSCHNDGDQFASGTNYHFSLNVGSNPTSISDFTASNFGYDRRNTFTPGPGDQFLIRRTDNNDWRRFVVTTWSPTANSVSNGWETTKRTDGGETQHPYWANGTVYGTGGSAESTSYAWHFNGCALAGNCANGNGGDSAAFSDYSQWAWSMNGYKAYGSSHRNQPGAALSWGTSALSEGGSLYIQIFYRKAGTQ